MLEEPKFKPIDLVIFEYDKRIAYGRILEVKKDTYPLYGDNMQFMDLNRVLYMIHTSDPDILPKGVYYNQLYIEEHDIICEFKPKFNIGEEVLFEDKRCKVKAIHVDRIHGIGIVYFYDLYLRYGIIDPKCIAENRIKPFEDSVFIPYTKDIPIPDSIKMFAAPCPTIDIEPIKDITELAKQYVSIDVKACDEFYKKVIEDDMFYFKKREVEKMLRNNSIKVDNFETLIYSDSKSVECNIKLSMGFEEARKLRSTFNNSDRDMADAMAQGLIDYMSKPRGRNSGRYPWVNSSGINFQGKYYKTNGLPVPKKVIFNGPATVVLWTDNTKTVVKKSEDEPDDREKALMYCVFKKFLDDKKRDMDKYLKLFYKVLEEDDKDEKKEN